MLYIVLVLVLAALGLLVSALITASSLWAWVSIGLSVLAGLILVADWLRRRRRAAAPAASPTPDEPAEPVEPVAESPAEPVEPTAPPEEPAEEEQTVLIPAAGELGDPADTPEPETPEAPAAETPAAASASADETPEPDEDPEVEPDPDAGDAILADLEDVVVVVDEHPRYHLTSCAWLGTRDTIPIGVGEARQLGFTPCARCRPNATLVAAHS